MQRLISDLPPKHRSWLRTNISVILLLGFIFSSSFSVAYAQRTSESSVLVRYSLESGRAAKTTSAESKLRRLIEQHSHLAKRTVESKVKWFESLPMVALSADEALLRALESDPAFVVMPNVLHRPLLAQSVSRVYPTQNSSPFHGNDQWAIAVLDTGVEKTHAFLSGSVVSEACYSDGGGQPSTTSLCPGGALSSTAVNSGVACNLDGCEHGTQVAGTALGDGANVDGVARDAKLISIQVYSQVNDESFCFPQLSCLGAFTSDIIAGLERVYALRNQIDIAAVTVSLGSDQLFSGTCDEQPEKAIIDLLRAAGIAVIAAAGNSGATSRMQAPACISSAIAVAATQKSSENPWAANNISSALDLFAPGVNINTSTLNNGFASATGTSLAAAHVAGAWAVLKSADPDLSVSAGEQLLSQRGPNVSQHSVSRRRIDVSGVLSALNPPPPPNPAPGTNNPVVAPLLILLLDDDDG